MICWSDYHTCLHALFNRLAKKEIALFVVVNNIEKGSYALLLFGDDDLNWDLIATGDWRIVLCMTAGEIWELLMTPLMPYFPEVKRAASAPSVSPGE